MKVGEDLLHGTILVRHLELIEKHTDQFLGIWESSTFPSGLQPQVRLR